MKDVVEKLNRFRVDYRISPQVIDAALWLVKLLPKYTGVKQVDVFPNQDEDSIRVSAYFFQGEDPNGRVMDFDIRDGT